MAEGNVSAPVADRPTSSPAVRIYAVVLGIGMACAVAIVLVHDATQPIIRRNTIALRKQAILDVLPAARSSAAFRLTDAGKFEATSPDNEDADLVFAGYDADNHLVGLAIETHGMGYQDLIRLLYGYSFEQQAIVGIRVLQTRETPGLGDRIETDADFLRNFAALDVRLNSAGDSLDHEIEFVKPGKKDSAWQIDGISGATITSRATAVMLRESAARWIPRVYARRDDFRFTSGAREGDND